jgi:hypothetical protein
VSRTRPKNLRRHDPARHESRSRTPNERLRKEFVTTQPDRNPWAELYDSTRETSSTPSARRPAREPPSHVAPEGDSCLCGA